MVNHHSLVRTGALAFVLLAATTLTAVAAPVIWDFTATTSAGAGAGTASGSGISNTRTYTSSVPGLTLTVTAWSTTGAGNTLARARVGHHGSAGLGVCNATEYSGCGSPQHQVDNIGAQDFVLFQFSLPVDPTTVTIRPYGDGTDGFSGNNADRDVRYFVNSAALALSDITGALPSALGTQFDSAASVSDSARDVAIDGTGSARTLLFGTPSVKSKVWDWRTWGYVCTSGAPDCDPDLFKIHKLVVDYRAPPPGGAGDPVSAPATLALLGAALAGLGIARRRRA